MSSNLSLNYGKTEILPIGYITAVNNPFKLKWVKERVYALGTWFYKDTIKGNHVNHELKLQNLKSTLKMYKKTHLTWYGKIQVIKSFAISKILYSLSSLSTPEWFVKQVQDELIKFLWDEKPSRIKFTTAINDYEWGGLRLPHVESVVFASKAMWIKRLIQHSSHEFFTQYLPEMEFIDFIHCDFDPDTLSPAIPTFYRQVLYAWFSIKPKLAQDNIANTIIWLNKNIRIDGKMVFYKEWYTKGVKHIKDILDNHGKPFEYRDFMKKFGIECNFLRYIAIAQSVKALLNKPNVDKPSTLEINKLQSKTLYKQNIKPIVQKPSSLQYYSNKLALDFTDHDWNRIFVLPRKTTVNNFLRELQLKINHHTYATDSYVSRFNKSVNKHCKFCSEENNIVHWFLSCKKLSDFWKLFKRWILDIFECNLSEDPATGTF